MLCPTQCKQEDPTCKSPPPTSSSSCLCRGLAAPAPSSHPPGGDCWAICNEFMKLNIQMWGEGHRRQGKVLGTPQSPALGAQQCSRGCSPSLAGTDCTNKSSLSACRDALAIALREMEFSRAWWAAAVRTHTGTARCPELSRAEGGCRAGPALPLSRATKELCPGA